MSIALECSSTDTPVVKGLINVKLREYNSLALSSVGLILTT